MKYSAFPTENLMNEVIGVTAQNNGMKLSDYEKCINMKRKKIEKCVKYLEVNGDIYKENFDIIEPRKKWPIGCFVDGKNKILENYLCSEGRVLSNYGDGGWGKSVARGKYTDNHFGDELVEASCELLIPFVQEKQIQWVTSIPSLRRPELVKDFAKSLADRLGLPYLEALEKTHDAIPQKELNNSNLQWDNAFTSFETRREISGGNVLLVDDMVDSRWTFTSCGYKLRKAGSGEVFPFALANSAGRNGED